jgi:MFS family permease
MDIKDVKEDPKIYFIALTFVNLLNYIDRGIIPGSTNEFNAFIKDDLDTDQPDVYLGLLQSSFIIGFSIAVIVFSNSLHYYSPFFICGVGLSIWVLAVILSGVAKYTGSYYFLLICRMLSGVGEASFQCSIPPWIAKNANPESRGKWLSIFFTAIPLGIAIGYNILKRISII